jgi:YhgE/Pip-like protein
MLIAIREGFGSVFRNKFNRFAIIAVVLIAALFGLLCVTAFWNPEEKLKDFPVAVINLDEGKYGGDIIKNLKENDNVKWEFYEENIFQDGIENTDYSFGFMIPANFSESVQSAQNGTPQPAEIIYCSNMRKNFLLSQFSRNIKNIFGTTVSASITREYATGAFEALYAISEGIVLLNVGAAVLSENINTLDSSISQSWNAYQTAMNTLLAGYSSIVNNADLPDIAKVAALEKLYTNLNTAYTQYATAQGQIVQGSATLADGADKLLNALADNAEGEAVTVSPEDMGAFIAEPVIVSSDIYGEIGNYGTGFSPLFMSLGLWIGALMLFFLIQVRSPQAAGLSRAQNVFGRFIVYGTFGIAEVLAITGGALLLGVEVVSIPVFMLFAWVVSLVFVGIMQLVHLLFSDLVSKAICVILAILQISAGGGTFPVDLTGSFFVAIHPFLPFSYSIDGFREIISGGNWQSLSATVGILLAVLVVTWVLSLIACKWRLKSETEVVEG